jgi:hypothetical protein
LRPSAYEFAIFHRQFAGTFERMAADNPPIIAFACCDAATAVGAHARFSMPPGISWQCVANGRRALPDTRSAHVAG